jgi:hypothetical protein
MAVPPSTVPDPVADYAARTVEYVERALGVVLEYDSDTLPVLDHYLRSVPAEPGARALVVATSGAYFGELVRRLLGGRWEATGEEVSEWRVVLPTGVQFSPAGFVAAAIARDDVDDFDTALEAPPRMRPYLAETLARMGEVTEDEFYSLCGRLDTIEHVHEVLVAVAARLLGEAEERADDDPDADLDDDPPTN